MNPSLQFVKHGDPAKVLQLAQVPLEAGPAPGFVRVEIKARAVNPADLLFVEGVYGKEVGDQIKLGKAQTGGSECSGVVSAVGEGVTNVAVGQRVYAGTGFPATRAWALHCDARAAAVVPLPPQVSFESGAQLLVNPMTAIGFLETMKADGLVRALSSFSSFFFFLPLFKTGGRRCLLSDCGQLCAVQDGAAAARSAGLQLSSHLHCPLLVSEGRAVGSGSAHSDCIGRDGRCGGGCESSCSSRSQGNL